MQWAYAGLAIDMVGAAYSHLMVQGAGDAVPPVVIAEIRLISYV